jgi:hypothetical protein
MNRSEKALQASDRLKLPSEPVDLSRRSIDHPFLDAGEPAGNAISFFRVLAIHFFSAAWRR